LNLAKTSKHPKIHSQRNRNQMENSHLMTSQKVVKQIILILKTIGIW